MHTLSVNMKRQFHPYNHRNFAQISRGVNPDAYKTRRPSVQELMMDIPLEGGPKHMEDPFRLKDYPAQALDFKEPVAKYNSYGNFGISQKEAASHRKTMHRLRMDTEIIGLVNKTRKQR